jgi:hypothetical protein
MRLPDTAEAGIRTTPTVLGRASHEREEEGNEKKQSDGEEADEEESVEEEKREGRLPGAGEH